MKKIRTIKSYMIIYSMMIIILLIILSAYTLSITRQYKEQIDGIFQKNIFLTNMKEQLVIVDKSLLGFLSSKNSSDFNVFMTNMEEIKQFIRESAYVISFNEEDLMLKDISNMFNSYIEQAELAINAKRERNIIEYTESYEEAQLIKSYIFEYINELNNRQFYRNYEKYSELTKQFDIMQTVTLILIFDTILLTICVVYAMSSKMVKPITKLSHSVLEISRGLFDTEAIIVEEPNELKILAEAFNKMKKSISVYIKELKTKAETENKLRDQQIANLKMKYLLDKAKLYALQSQINPHFLFNTINAGVQLSMIEGADKTSEFLGSMSKLFRYNIKNINAEVTLGDEIENIKDYYDLLKVRFEEFIRFEFSVDENILDVVMPPLILQPLVENAYIHGLSSKEEGGEILIVAQIVGKEVVIQVEDNGVGIEEKKIETLLQERDESNHSKKGTGIGLANVINRLHLFYHKEDVIRIESVKNEWTRIIIKIPIKVHESKN